MNATILNSVTGVAKIFIGKGSKLKNLTLIC